MPYQRYDQSNGVMAPARLDYIEDGLSHISQGGGENPTWDEVEDKPDVFPAESHTHDLEEVGGLQSALEGKADTSDIPSVPSTDFGDLTGSVDGAEGGNLQSILEDLAARLGAVESANNGD